MAGPIKTRLLKLQNRLTAAYGTDISTPRARRAAWWHFQLMDHAFLRVFWTNLEEIAPGFFRSNQPSPAQFRRLSQKGIKTVLNLRGTGNQGYYLFEREACARYGMTMIDLQMSAKQAPYPETLERLIALMQTAPKPMLVHCKSGADRTGLASALYLLVICQRPMAEVMRQLSFRYMHLTKGPAGIQDHVLRVYYQAHAKTGIGFMDWLRNDYDRDAVTASFQRWRAGDTAGPF